MRRCFVLQQTRSRAHEAFRLVSFPWRAHPARRRRRKQFIVYCNYYFSLFTVYPHYNTPTCWCFMVGVPLQTLLWFAALCDELLYVMFCRIGFREDVRSSVAAKLRISQPADLRSSETKPNVWITTRVVMMTSLIHLVSCRCNVSKEIVQMCAWEMKRHHYWAFR